MATINKIPEIDPAFIERHKSALRRKNRQVLYLNDSEVDAIAKYCKTYNIKRRSALLREIIMNKILSVLDESHPTLF